VSEKRDFGQSIRFREVRSRAGDDSAKWACLRGVRCRIGHGPSGVVARVATTGEVTNLTLRLDNGRERLLVDAEDLERLEFSASDLGERCRSLGFGRERASGGYRYPGRAHGKIGVRTRATVSGGKAWLAQEMRDRGIEQLCHFTQLCNVPSILANGLLSRKALEQRPDIDFSPCDEDRLDRHRDASCLSLTFPNYRMFMGKRGTRSGKGWAVLLYRPEVLLGNRCGFYYTNASNSCFLATPLAEVEGAEAFAALFADTVSSGTRFPGLEGCYPTDPQAEVLVYGRIPTRLMIAVAVAETGDRQLLQLHLVGASVRVDGKLFKPRCDWRQWKRGEPCDSRTAAGGEVPF